jgi:MFS family permease
VLAAFLLLALAGLGRSLLDVAGRTLLQRAAPPDVLARIFGALEGVSMAGLALGAILAPLLVQLAGARAAVALAGAILPVVLVAAFARLRALDAKGTAPVVEIGLLRLNSIFGPLGAAALDGIARSLEPVALPAGAVAIRAGEPGDTYYVVADGKLAASPGGAMTRGDGFGEIALLRDVPRTATVTAETDTRLLALDRATFLAAVTGHPLARREADRVASERIRAGVAGVAAR